MKISTLIVLGVIAVVGFMVIKSLNLLGPSTDSGTKTSNQDSGSAQNETPKSSFDRALEAFKAAADLAKNIFQTQQKTT